jgi:uncharacterized cupredoxin-like copper-binding protein
MRYAWFGSLLIALLSTVPSGGFARTSATPTQTTLNTSTSPPPKSFWFGHPGRAPEVTRTISITAKSSRFIPGNIEVHVGETVKFEITNQDKVEHEFVLGNVAEQVAHDKEMGAVPSMPMDDDNGVSIPPGQSAVLIWTFTHEGELEYACHLPGHYVAGMVGWVMVRT